MVPDKLLELKLDANVILNKKSKFLLGEGSIVNIPKGTLLLKNGEIKSYKQDVPMYLSCSVKPNSDEFVTCPKINIYNKSL